jgi:hypothetical protein
MSKDGAHSRLQSRYNRLWSATIKKIRDGNIQPDPVLAPGMPDRRRGLTVIARPSSGVRQRVAAFLRQLRHLEPDQYYYAPSEFHLTVLSLFTATANYRQFLAQAGFYVSAVDAALRKVAPIRIEFSGVTASSGAIMIQGFFENEALNEVDRKSTRLNSSHW